MYLVTLGGVVCIGFMVRLFFFADLSSRTVPSDVLQGALVGFGNEPLRSGSDAGAAVCRASGARPRSRHGQAVWSPACGGSTTRRTFISRSPPLARARLRFLREAR